MFIYIFGLFLCIFSIDAHTYHLGDCPKVEPIANFNINKFLGKWHVIQKTSTGSACLINNYTVNPDHNGQFKIEQISEHFLLGLTSVDHKYHYTGDLTIPDVNNPGAMHVKFPLNVIGGASYTVFTTDYNTYAGIFTCQKLAFAHRQSATILSRSPTLEKNYVDKIRNSLSGFGIDPFSLSIIKQDNCTDPQGETTNINIHSETFSPKNVAGAVSKAGSKIEEGIEAIADSAKNLYHTVRGDHESSEENEKNAKLDAEWLP